MDTSFTQLKIKNLAMALALTGLALLSRAALAHNPIENGDLKVDGAWARATVAGQKVTGVFMRLTAAKDYKLVGAASSVAGLTQVHEMKMDNGVMKMNELADGLALPAGKTVELKPGGYHIMLLDLKQAVKADSTIDLALKLEDSAKKMHTAKFSIPARMSAPSGASPVGSSSTPSMDHDHAAQHAHMQAPAAAANTTPQAAIEAKMKSVFDKPNALLTVGPVTVQGERAVAGWQQAGKGGRAFLSLVDGAWTITHCAGKELTQASVLEKLGMASAPALSLATAVKQSESGATPSSIAKMNAFKGLVPVEGKASHGQHAGHAQPAH